MKKWQIVIPVLLVVTFHMVLISPESVLVNNASRRIADTGQFN